MYHLGLAQKAKRKRNTGGGEKQRPVVHNLIFIFLGILKNENGTPEDEENFEEAIKNVNTALNTTQVFKELWRESDRKGFSEVLV